MGFGYVILGQGYAHDTSYVVVRMC